MDLPFFPGHRTATKAVQSFARRPVPALLHPIGFSSIFVSKPHSYVLASLLMALASLHPLITETRDLQVYSICKPHSYVLASLLMALSSLHLLIFEILEDSILFRL